MAVDDFQSKTTAFLNWLRDNGASVSDKVTLADLRSKNAGRGVIANSQFEEDETIFTIPRSSILTIETSSLPVEVHRQFNDPWLSTNAALIYEHCRGSASKWRAYLDVLPSTFNTLMFWSDDEMKWLEGSLIVEKVSKKDMNARFSEQLIPVLAPHLPDTPPSRLLELCHQMGSTIMAYAFDIERTAVDDHEDGWEEDEEENEFAVLPKGMIPMADMLNADGARNNAKLYYEDDNVVMRAIKQIKSGEEIFNDYGELPSSDLLRRYGYVTPNYAPYAVVEVTTELIRDTAQRQCSVSDNCANVRMALLSDHDALDASYDIGLPNSAEGQFSPELCLLLNTLTMTDAEVDRTIRHPPSKPVLSPKAQDLIYFVLVRRQAMYPAQRPTLLDSSMDRSRFECAAQVINEEQAVIAKAIDAIMDLRSQGKKRMRNTFDEDVQSQRELNVREQ